MKTIIDETNEKKPETISAETLEQPEAKKTNYTAIIIAVVLLVVTIAVAMFINNRKKSKEINNETEPENQ